MKRVVLNRTLSLPDGMFGLISVDNKKWFTCERPWLDNQNNVSCIPKGTYLCRWTLSPRLKKFTYEVTQVPNRMGIRIHSANFSYQVIGCIALGTSSGVMDSKRGVFGSVTAIRQFNEYLNQQDFQLKVV